MNSRPKISFGIIVLNGAPFMEYNLRALYSYAHQIIVVEGASPAAACIATQDGHSTDGTLDILYGFKRNEDPEDKITIITAEDEGHPNGFWPGEKDEQSAAYAKRATGTYLWQVDIDEFYQPFDMSAVIDMLAEDPTIEAVSFHTLTFWGGVDYITDGFYLRRGGEEFHRLFKWGPGYRYTTHRPPTVNDPSGINLRNRRWLSGTELRKRNIFMYHYSLIFPKQVREKCAYYDNAPWVSRNRYRAWADESYFCISKPFRVHNVYDFPSWLERYHGTHPPQIDNLTRDIRQGLKNIELRRTADIDSLLRSSRYRLIRSGYKFACFIDPAFQDLMNSNNVIIRLLRRLYRQCRSWSRKSS